MWCQIHDLIVAQRCNFMITSGNLAAVPVHESFYTPGKISQHA